MSAELLPLQLLHVLPCSPLQVTPPVMLGGHGFWPGSAPTTGCLTKERFGPLHQRLPIETAQHSCRQTRRTAQRPTCFAHALPLGAASRS